MIMDILPFNNFDEHVARFTATKKNISTGSNVGVNKKFTFKKSLSLNHTASSSFDRSTAFKCIENKKSEAKESLITPDRKQIFGYDSLNAASKKTELSILSKNEENKKPSDIRKYFVSGESTPCPETENDFIQKYKVPNIKPVKTCQLFSSNNSSESKENLFTVTKDALSNKSWGDLCTENIYEKKIAKLPHAKALVNNVCKKNSEIENQEAQSTSGQNRAILENSPSHCRNTSKVENSFKHIENCLQRFQDKQHSNSESVSFLRAMNIKVMTQICDILATQEELLIQNKDLGQLVSVRKKILDQYSLAHNDSTEDASNLFNSTHATNDFLGANNLKKVNSSPLFNSFQSAKSFETKESTQLGSPICINDASLSKKDLFCSNVNQSRKSSAASIDSSKLNCPPQFKDYSGLMKDNSFDEHSFEDDGDFFSDSLMIKPPIAKYLNNSVQHCPAVNTASVAGTSQMHDSKERSKEKIIAGKFYGNQRDDGATAQFKGFKFPFSPDVMQIFQNVFGLKKFRHNQLEAINAALLKEDCFILMPTGGGKSLCYQLPALVSSGVTIVVSPLRSLIMDQVQKLCSLDVPASSLTGDADTSTVNYVYSQLSAREPNIKLLYVTPEKISASAKLVSCLESLYSRNMIQRFIIDEAHCVSQWGHDFRPDYKKLNVLRKKFQNVPLVALTATATQRVRTDILHQLGMENPKWFLQSFNRPNLKYEVRPKSKGVVDDIIELLKSKFKNMCGIVYCLSRNDCDTVANVLQKNGIRAAAYHAGLNNRDEVQESWINDKFKVICATIAFGMGIDKPDVRFVIHHAMPKSIEGYYQESGRAGRDGERSWCILYYSYKDMQRIKRMIMQDDSNRHSWNTHFDNLFRMVHYCENKADCRRVWMLEYFGEIFDKSLCSNNPQTACDNCYSKETFIECDVTEDAKSIIKCVSQLVDKRKRNNYTLTYFVDLYKGAKTKKILAAGHNQLQLYGKGQSWRRSDAERLLRKLVLDQYLQEDMVINKMDLPIIYIYLGKRAKELMMGKTKVVLLFQDGKDKRPQNNVASSDDKEIQQLTEKCYNELIEVSKAIASERNMHYTNVINVEALRQMSREMPMTEEDMLAIPHITHAVFEKYGKRFLEVTEKYAAERCVIDAERADQALLNACVEDVDAWSDTDTTSNMTSKKGIKRKAKTTARKTVKKQKKFFPKKNGKAKNKTGYSSYMAKKRYTQSQNKTSGRAPGFMPNPKAAGKPALRSFLQTPTFVLN